ncbi:transmembrane protein 100 [Phyllopteryx taeniolatus]|uniref:transmembrane protein 100 n=1 Tax=Phycodurus eques TaxID=693459 RepID=UPI002ACEBBC2|nr:transmembrane protein 100 [Phycodurus eques]XP_061606453.1 transmembrane protein 100 [Phyllopteryx taeniolatus]
MGCTTVPLACQPQEGQSLEAGGAKVPEVLSSLDRLSQATGGMEKSWYRCIFPFGIISLVIGVAGTGVTYTYNDLPQTKVVSVVLLVTGLLLLLMATACWTVHKKKRRKKKEGGSFSSEQCPL